MTNLKVKRIDVHELKNKLEHDPDLCLIDVRELNEWNEVHILCALHLPKDQIASCIEAKIPNKSQPIYLYCKAGVRSLYAAETLINLGYQEVSSVDGGIMKWLMSGYPVSAQVKTPEQQL